MVWMRMHDPKPVFLGGLIGSTVDSDGSQCEVLSSLGTRLHWGRSSRSQLFLPNIQP